MCITALSSLSVFTEAVFVYINDENEDRHRSIFLHSSTMLRFPIMSALVCWSIASSN
jgi:hypothetical protein